MKRWLVLIVTFSSTVLCAQDYRPGFIIKANGDSLTGFVENAPRTNSKVCHFKASRGQKKQTFHPQELKAFGIIGYRYYQSKTIPMNGHNETVFVETLVKGKASLYRYLEDFYIDKDSIFLLPPPKRRQVEVKDVNYLVDDKKYIGLLNIILADCHLSADQTSYTERNLTYLVQNYNRCLGAPGITFKINKPWTKLNVRAFGAFDQASVSLNGFEKFSIKQSTSVPFGIGLDISSPRISDKIFFLLEAWVVKKSFQGYSEQVTSFYTQRTDLYLHPSFLKIPIGVQFNLKRESNTPYLKFGLSQYLLTSISATEITETETAGTVATDLSSPNVDKKDQTGLWIGAGYSRRVNFLNLFAEIRYEKNNGFINPNVSSTSSGSVVNILFGLKY